MERSGGRWKDFWFSALGLKARKQATLSTATTNASSGDASSNNIICDESSTALDVVSTWYFDADPKIRVRRPLGLPMLLVSKGFPCSVGQRLLVKVDVDEAQALPHDVVARERLDESDFVVCEHLGSGAFGSVAKCRKKSTGEIFAIKRLIKDKFASSPTPLEASLPRQEHDSLIFSGRHPNVCALECAFETSQHWFLIIEFCDQGSLRDLMSRDGTPGLEIKESARLGQQALQALHYLHSRNILHRDIKPENCGISSKPDPKTLKLFDFGFAARVPGCQSRAVFGSYGYLAPEIEEARCSVGPLREANDKYTYDNRVDLYSFGIMLFVMIVGQEASHHGKLWTHPRFRSMLRDVNYPLWTCRAYKDKGIDPASIYPKLKNCGALATISALTETQAKDRPANASVACVLPLFILVEQIS